MLSKRLIPCLDLKDGRVVKGVNFVHLVDAGDPVETAKLYNAFGADELVFLDITASYRGNTPMWEIISRASEQVFLPLTVGGGIRSVEGIQHPDYLQGGMIDPSVTADRTLKKPRMLWADPQKRPWRELPSLLGFLHQEESDGMRCLQRSWCVPRLAAAPVDSVRLWSGGIRLRGNAGEQYLSGSDDVVESEVSLSVSCLEGGETSDWFMSFQIGMGKLEKLGNLVYAAVAGYYKEEKADPADRAKRASLEFWQQAERFFPALVDACNQAGEEARNAVLRKARACALDCYSRACPQETARQLALWARHRPFFGRGASA